MALLTTRPTGECIEHVDMTVPIRVEEQKRLAGRRKGDRVKDAGAVVDVKGAVLGRSLIHGNPEVEGAITIYVSHADCVGPALPRVLSREPLSRLVAEGAVPEPNQKLDPPAAEVRALETSEQVSTAITVDVEAREADQDRRYAERLRRQCVRNQ